VLKFLTTVSLRGRFISHCGNKYREPGVKRPGFRPFRPGL
jgi:hypothetical protein